MPRLRLRFLSGGTCQPEFRIGRSLKNEILKDTLKILSVLYITCTQSTMPEAIPAVIAPHFDHNPPSPSLNLVTSTLSTPAHWVLLRYVFAALSGIPDVGQRATTAQVNARHPVVFVSLLRPRDLWLELSRKIVSTFALSSYQ
jgi:hypothetical protein